MKSFIVTVTQKGQITLPSELRKEAEWTKGSKLVFRKDDENRITLTKKKNLYDTAFGDYDFQSDLESDPELTLTSSSGNEGWGFESN